MFFAWTGFCTKTVFFHYIVKDMSIFFKLELAARKLNLSEATPIPAFLKALACERPLHFSL